MIKSILCAIFIFYPHLSMLLFRMLSFIIQGGAFQALSLYIAYCDECDLLFTSMSLAQQGTLVKRGILQLHLQSSLPPKSLEQDFSLFVMYRID